jgi:hypothetical protein
MSPRDDIPSYIPLGTRDAGAAELWSIYLSQAEMYDKALVESWRDDMQGILIFVRESPSYRSYYTDPTLYRPGFSPRP